MLGLREGATETAAVASGLLSDLVTRGLPPHRTLLFVIDGAPGLRRAISRVLGSCGAVHRCQLHKLRNVLGHLPERLHASVAKALRVAWERRFRGARGAGAGARPPRRDGVHPGGPREDADGEAARSDRGARTYSAHDEHHREPDG